MPAVRDAAGEPAGVVPALQRYGGLRVPAGLGRAGSGSGPAAAGRPVLRRGGGGVAGEPAAAGAVRGGGARGYGPTGRVQPLRAHSQFQKNANVETDMKTLQYSFFIF